MQITLEEIEFSHADFWVNFTAIADMDNAEEGGYYCSDIIYPTGLRATMAIADPEQLEKIEADIRERCQTMADESPPIYDTYDGAAQ